MAEHEIKLETEQDIRKFFGDIFDKLCSGVDFSITPEMESVLKRVLEDEDLVAAIPEITDMIYQIFVMKEFHSNSMDSRLGSMLSINFSDNSIQQYTPINQKTFDPHSLRMQTLKLKETVTDRILFI